MLKRFLKKKKVVADKEAPINTAPKELPAFMFHTLIIDESADDSGDYCCANKAGYFNESLFYAKQTIYGKSEQDCLQ